MSIRTDLSSPSLRLLQHRTATAEVVEPVVYFSNFRPEGPATGRDSPSGAYLDIHEITADLYDVTGGWPKQYGGKLFVEGEGYRPRMLHKVRDVIAYIESLRKVRWLNGPEAISQEVFFAHLEATAEQVTSIEAFPHEPRIHGACYMHPPLPAAVPGLVDRFLDYFCPATPEDRTLMKAVLLTLFWGAPVARPAFLLTAENGDDRGGRGVGKTRFVDLVASLVGGAIDVSPDDDIEKVKTRLLSGEGSGKRLARIDNVKSHKWSSGRLEGLFTADRISGHRMYVGEASRPNLLTWMITMNGPNVSPDLAQRMIPIKLGRPVHRADWEAEVASFLHESGRAMIAEIIQILQSIPPPIAAGTRQAAWAATILAHAGGGSSTVALIAERQAAINADDDERATVESYFRVELGRIFHTPAEQLDVFITSQQLTKLLGLALSESINVNQAKQRLFALSIPEFTAHRVAQARGVRWRGVNCPGDSTTLEFEDDRLGSEPLRPRRSRSRWG